MICVYESNARWEWDFITRELLPEATPVRALSKDEITDIHSYNDLDVIALVFSSNLHHYEEICNLIEKTKPKVVFHLSDEFGDRPEFQQLGDIVPLVVRQYQHPEYPSPPNVVRMPLGYMSGMFQNTTVNLDLQPPSRRAWAWNWVGSIKQDRELMLESMSSLEPYWYGSTSVADMAARYMDSIFVPCGRGNVSLECFRIYESAACGAIPVVVGPIQELTLTFGSELPPWVFAESWEEAVACCERLQRDPNNLDRLHNRVVAHWRRSVESLRAGIYEVLGQ